MLLMLGVGAIVGVVVICMYLPIFNMMNIANTYSPPHTASS